VKKPSSNPHSFFPGPFPGLGAGDDVGDNAPMVPPHLALRRDRPLVFGHRGARASAPENTVVAFDRALELGADGLEFDVRLSRDGVPIVLHDARLDRTTNGTGSLSAWLSSDLTTLDAGYRFTCDGRQPFRGQGIWIPTLRDVLDRYRDAPLILEMKGRSPALAERALAEVRDAGALDRVAFGSFSHVTLATVRRLDPAAVTSASRLELRLALVAAWFGRRPWRRPYQVCQAPQRFRGRPIVSRRLVRLMQAAGIPVQVWTVNAAGDVRRLLEWGVAGFITDCPDVVVAALGRSSTC